MTRREMIRTTGKLGAAALIGSTLLSRVSAAETPSETALPQVPRKLLGKTGEKIPILVMGGMPKFDPAFDPRIPEALRFGVNYFDLADCYAGGASEVGFGNFVAKSGKRKDLWITTKSCNQDPVGMTKVLDVSLQRLQTDHVDLFFLHDLKNPDQLNDDMMKAAEQLKKSGKIRFFGFSTHEKSVVPAQLAKAATLPWIDAIMFKYNFRDYDDAELNKAIDAAHKANIGLIAMKTQGSAVSFDDRVKKFEGAQFNHQQAVLKAVWDDERITAAVSQMASMDQLKQNIGAALDPRKMTDADRAAIRAYADATRQHYCAGCQHICNKAVPQGVAIGTTLRYLMYHDTYGETATSRELFAELPAGARDFANVDFSAAAALCPRGVDIAAHMKRAAQVLA